MIEWTTHGGRLKSAQTAYPDAPRPWVDLSTGINPSPYPTAPFPPEDWARLPDPDSLHDLELAAAAHFSLSCARPIALPGTELGLRLLATLGLPTPLRFIAPAYPGYKAAFPGAEPLRADDVEMAASEGGTLIIANPNNPDGRIWPAETLATLANLLAQKQGMLILDEAFADVRQGVSLLSEWGSLPKNVIVLRSFGKFFGLAGLRLGFAVAPAPWDEHLRQRLGDWPVSAAAIRIGAMAYKDRPWVDQTRERLPKAARRLDDLLESHGLRATGDCPLFRLVETSDAAGLFDRLAGSGILTRPFAYAPQWLRIGLPVGEDSWARLDKALRGHRG